VLLLLELLLKQRLLVLVLLLLVLLLLHVCIHACWHAGRHPNKVLRRGPQCRVCALMEAAGTGGTSDPSDTG
jgi:hypothetical protein